MKRCRSTLGSSSIPFLPPPGLPSRLPSFWYRHRIAIFKDFLRSNHRRRCLFVSSGFSKQSKVQCVTSLKAQWRVAPARHQFNRSSTHYPLRYQPAPATSRQCPHGHTSLPPHSFATKFPNQNLKNINIHPPRPQPSPQPSAQNPLTLNPESDSLYQKSQTLNPKSLTPYPKPSTLNPKP